MRRDQFILDLHQELIGDLFAGGGGMSEGIQIALNRHPDFAVNHNPDALSMHQANHPQTRHFTADVREVCPYEITEGRPVGYIHLSPDCTHFSQAKGGQPRSRKIRGLSWVAVHWAGTVRPRVISLECVPQILRWGPLIAKRDKATGRVVKLDGSIATIGEVVPVRDQFLIPDPKRTGETWQRFVTTLRSLGYVVEWRVGRACDFGAPTTRLRLMMWARRDGVPIRWPEPTHAGSPSRARARYGAAADCIDFSLPSQSIFGRPRPLAEASLHRVAAGVEQFVLNSGDPFLVPVTHHGAPRVHDIREPMRTITGAHRGEFALASPVLVKLADRGSDARGSGLACISEPQRDADKQQYATAAYLAQMNGGFNDVRGVPGHDLRRPMSAVTRRGSQQQLVTACLVQFRRNCDARSLREPLRAVTAGGQHHGLLQCVLSDEQDEGALRVAAFMRRYGRRSRAHAEADAPLEPVTVTIEGQIFAIVDLTLRMLRPRELFNAQGFPPDYVIDRGHDGRAFSLTKQVLMCGNSVSPPWAAAHISANLTDLALPCASLASPFKRVPRPGASVPKRAVGRPEPTLAAG